LENPPAYSIQRESRSTDDRLHVASLHWLQPSSRITRRTAIGASREGKRHCCRTQPRSSALSQNALSYASGVGTGKRSPQSISSWNASTSSGQPGATTVGYCLYRSQKKDTAKKLPKCPACEQVNLMPLLSSRCVDDLVKDHTTYYYVAIAINSGGGTSSPTNEAIAEIPGAAKQNPAPPDAASYPACRAPTVPNQPPEP